MYDCGAEEQLIRLQMGGGSNIKDSIKITKNGDYEPGKGYSDEYDGVKKINVAVSSAQSSMFEELCALPKEISLNVGRYTISLLGMGDDQSVMTLQKPITINTVITEAKDYKSRETTFYIPMYLLIERDKRPVAVSYWGQGRACKKEKVDMLTGVIDPKSCNFVFTYETFIKGGQYMINASVVSHYYDGTTSDINPVTFYFGSSPIKNHPIYTDITAIDEMLEIIDELDYLWWHS